MMDNLCVHYQVTMSLRLHLPQNLMILAEKRGDLMFMCVMPTCHGTRISEYDARNSRFLNKSFMLLKVFRLYN